MAKAALGAAAVATAVAAGAIMVIAMLVAICAYRTMTVSIVADITPCPLRTKANGVQKLVGYAGTGLMLVVIAALVPKGDNPDYLPVCMIQALLIPGAAVCYGIDGSWSSHTSTSTATTLRPGRTALARRAPRPSTTCRQASPPRRTVRAIGSACCPTPRRSSPSRRHASRVAQGGRASTRKSVGASPRRLAQIPHLRRFAVFPRPSEPRLHPGA